MSNNNEKESLNDNVETEQSDDNKLLEMVEQLNTRVHEKLATRRQQRESRSTQMRKQVNATGDYTRDALQKLSHDAEAPVAASETLQASITTMADQVSFL